MSKLQENPSALKREHPAFHNIKFRHFFFWGVIFALPDPIQPIIINAEPQHWWQMAIYQKNRKVPHLFRHFCFWRQFLHLRQGGLLQCTQSSPHFLQFFLIGLLSWSFFLFFNCCFTSGGESRGAVACFLGLPRCRFGAVATTQAGCCWSWRSGSFLGLPRRLLAGVASAVSVAVLDASLKIGEWSVLV